MVTILQTLIILFGIAFILGFLSRDLQAIFNPPQPATESASTETPEATAAAIAPPPETPKST